MLSSQLTSSLKKSGFFRRIVDCEDETELSGQPSNKATVLAINRNKQFFNHLSPNRNFRLYQEGCFGLQSERSKYKSQEYSINVKKDVVKRLQIVFQTFSKTIEQARSHFEAMEKWASAPKAQIKAEYERRKQLAIPTKALSGMIAISDAFKSSNMY